MKDALLLLATGMVCAFVASAFWRHLGSDGFGVLNSLLVTLLVVDNIQLRRKLRALLKLTSER